MSINEQQEQLAVPDDEPTCCWFCPLKAAHKCDPRDCESLKQERYERRLEEERLRQGMETRC